MSEPNMDGNEVNYPHDPNKWRDEMTNKYREEK